MLLGCTFDKWLQWVELEPVPWEEAVAHFGLRSYRLSKEYSIKVVLSASPLLRMHELDLSKVYGISLRKNDIWIFDLLLNSQSHGLKKKNPHGYCNVLAKILCVSSNMSLNIWAAVRLWWVATLLLMQPGTLRKSFLGSWGWKAFKPPAKKKSALQK